MQASPLLSKLRKLNGEIQDDYHSLQSKVKTLESENAALVQTSKDLEKIACTYRNFVHTVKQQRDEAILKLKERASPEANICQEKEDKWRTQYAELAGKLGMLCSTIFPEQGEELSLKTNQHVNVMEAVDKIGSAFREQKHSHQVELSNLAMKHERRIRALNYMQSQWTQAIGKELETAEQDSNQQLETRLKAQSFKNKRIVSGLQSRIKELEHTLNEHQMMTKVNIGGEKMKKKKSKKFKKKSLAKKVNSKTPLRNLSNVSLVK
eukprot:g2093.t1